MKNNDDFEKPYHELQQHTSIAYNISIELSVIISQNRPLLHRGHTL